MGDGGSLHTEGERAQALALMQAGETAEGAARALGLPSRTVQHWAARWREVAPDKEYPLLLASNIRLASRVYDVLHDMVDDLEALPPGKERLKHAMVANIIAGTAFDKVQRAQQGNSQTSVQIGQVQIIFSQQPDTIEATYQQIAEDPSG